MKRLEWHYATTLQGHWIHSQYRFWVLYSKTDCRTTTSLCVFRTKNVSAVGEWSRCIGRRQITRERRRRDVDWEHWRAWGIPFVDSREYGRSKAAAVRPWKKSRAVSGGNHCNSNSCTPAFWESLFTIIMVEKKQTYKQTYIYTYSKTIVRPFTNCKLDRRYLGKIGRLIN